MGSSSQEQIVDQHSSDVDVEWQAKYPVGTLIESSVYTNGLDTPDRYEVVSRDEYNQNQNRSLASWYLPVRLVWKDHDRGLSGYDGFRECHINRIVGTKTFVWADERITKQDVGPSAWMPDPWIPMDIKLDYNSLGYADAEAPVQSLGWWSGLHFRTKSNKPCPRFGVSYGVTMPNIRVADNKPNPRYGWRS